MLLWALSTLAIRCAVYLSFRCGRMAASGVFLSRKQRRRRSFPKEKSHHQHVRLFNSESAIVFSKELSSFPPLLMRVHPYQTYKHPYQTYKHPSPRQNTSSSPPDTSTNASGKKYRSIPIGITKTYNMDFSSSTSGYKNSVRMMSLPYANSFEQCENLAFCHVDES